MTTEPKGKRYRHKATELPGKFTAGFLTSMDGRFAEVKGLRARLDGLITDLGGVECLSRQEIILAERATFLQALLETREATFMRAGQLDLTAYIAGVNALASVLRTLGIQRRVKDVPNLQDYLRQKAEANTDGH